MAVQLELSTDLAQRLDEAARRDGLTPEAYVVKTLEQTLPRCEKCRREEAIAYLQSLIDEKDPEVLKEGQETIDYLVRVLDEHRPEGQKLFPPELKGISW